MTDKIKKPVTKGLAKVPLIMQLERQECGAAALCMILAYYGKWIPLEEVREACGVSRDGSSVLNVLKAARYYGLAAEGFRFEPDELQNEAIFPCIIYWNFNHLLVLNGFRNGKAYLNDPAKGEYSVSMETFDECFTGLCLLLEPTESFVPSGKPKSVLSFAAKRLKGAGAAVLFTVLTGIIGALLGFVRPAFSRVFIDRLLTGKDSDWAASFLLLLAAWSIARVIMSALHNTYSVRMDGKMAAVGSASYMWKILRMPMRFFSQRRAIDIQARQESNASVANTLIHTLTPILLDAVLTVVYFSVMIRYSVILTAVGLVSLTINTLVSSYISKQRINLSRASMAESVKLSAATISGISLIESIKASGAESGFFKKWSGHQANVNTQRVRSLKMNQYLGMIPQLVTSLANNTVVFLGAYLTMQGQFTVGMIMAFQGFLASFMSPARRLVSTGQTLQEMRTQMERIEDVMEYPEDSVFDESGSGKDYHKLSGNIELKNVCFGYAPLGKPLIKDFNMVLTPGKSVALVGTSGCGKSTMSKLISGLYKPWSGDILFDGKPLNQISKGVFRGSVAVVDQDIILFEDTIANNIKMWDNSIEDFEMILAARDAQIHDDIMQRPDGYQHKLIDDGKDFSGGQRQCLEIARALAQDPTVIILDEATSALDAKTEAAVVKAIQNRGITCIVIAHRLSTIRSCDEIIVMEHGEIVDRGTHRELTEKSGIYRDFVDAE